MSLGGIPSSARASCSSDQPIAPRVDACKTPESRLFLMMQRFVGEYPLNQSIFEKGIRCLGKIERLTEQELYQKGIDLQKEKILGFEAPSPERCLLQMICFQHVSTLKDNLYRRALHNEAFLQINVAVLLANVMPELRDKLVALNFPDINCGAASSSRGLTPELEE